MILILS